MKPDDDWMASPWYWLVAALCVVATIVISVFYPWGFATADAGRYMDSAPLVPAENVSTAVYRFTPAPVVRVGLI